MRSGCELVKPSKECPPSGAGRLDGRYIPAKSLLIPTRQADEFQAQLLLDDPADHCDLDHQWCGRVLVIRQIELQRHLVAFSYGRLALHRTTPRRQLIADAVANQYSTLEHGNRELNPKT